MKNINYVKIKIIEEETPERAEYEINDFLEHCRQNIIQVLDISSHVNSDAESNYCYTFIIQYKGVIQEEKSTKKVWNDERW